MTLSCSEGAAVVVVRVAAAGVTTVSPPPAVITGANVVSASALAEGVTAVISFGADDDSDNETLSGVTVTSVVEAMPITSSKPISVGLPALRPTVAEALLPVAL